MRTGRLTLVGILLIWAVASSTARAAEAPALSLQGVRILVCHPYWDLQAIPAVQRLKAAGAEVRGGDLASLTWDQAQQFHVIIAVYEAEGEPQKPGGGEGSVAVLAKFVKAGGGLRLDARIGCHGPGRPTPLCARSGVRLVLT